MSNTATATLLKLEPMSEKKVSGTIGWQFATYKHDYCSREELRTVSPRNKAPDHVVVLCSTCADEKEKKLRESPIL